MISPTSPKSNDFLALHPACWLSSVMFAPLQIESPADNAYSFAKCLKAQRNYEGAPQVVHCQGRGSTLDTTIGICLCNVAIFVAVKKSGTVGSSTLLGSSIVASGFSSLGLCVGGAKWVISP